MCSNQAYLISSALSHGLAAWTLARRLGSVRGVPREAVRLLVSCTCRPSPAVASEGCGCHCQASQEHVTAVVRLSGGTWCLWIIQAVSSRLNVWTIFRWWYRRHAAGSGDVCTSGAHRVSGSPSRAEDPDSRLRLELCRSRSRACWNGPVYVLFTVYGYFLARKSGVYKYSHMLNLRSP